MRFSGAVGYAEQQEVTPGVWKEIITEKNYYGDVIRDSRRLESPHGQGLGPGQSLNDDIAVGNSFSLMADAYAYENFTKMRYVVWNGEYWTVTDVEIRRPRLILTVGGLWNGDKA